MDTIRIDTGRLRTAGETVLAALGGAENNTEAISSVLSKLGSMWEGEAAESFKSLLEEDIAQVRGTCAELRRIAESESEAASSYEECEMKVIEEASAGI